MPLSRTFSDTARAEQSTVNRLMPLVYEELRAMAGAYFRAESIQHTLQPTALVHEAYLKLARQGHPDWQGRTHFLASAARAMRQILVDHARRKRRSKRWGECLRVELGEGPVSFGQRPEDVLALDQALLKLARKDPRKAHIVELRYFGGLTMEEIAELLGVSKSTVEKEWTFIRAWLRREFSQGQV